MVEPIERAPLPSEELLIAEQEQEELIISRGKPPLRVSLVEPCVTIAG